MSDPKISIVTVVFNNKEGLEKTIQSIINQTYKNKEFIIIDGGSTDGTIDIIKKYKDYIDYYISEQDKGIYDAMNKGINLSNGKWINFMNSGDMFVSNDTLKVVAKYLEKYNHYALIYGNKIQNNKVVLPMNIKSLEVGEIMACHQAMFFNKDILGHDLKYDLRFKIYGDYELVNRIYKNKNNKIKYINVNIAIFEGNGISSKVTYQKRKDKYFILYSHYGFRGILKGLWHRLVKGFRINA